MDEGLADAHEFLQSEWESIAGHKSLQVDQLYRHFVEKFGGPEELAAAYAAAGESLIGDAESPGNVGGSARRRRLLLRSLIFVALIAAAIVGARLALGPAAGKLFGPTEAGPIWAEGVVSFQLGDPRPTQSVDPLAALGPPDCRNDDTDLHSYVALGCGGKLVVEFKDAALYDGEGPDLAIIEVGAMLEPVEVSVSADGQNWTELGRIQGANSMLDLRARVPSGSRFRFVRLVDLEMVGGTDNQWPGADIDAVGAIHAVKSP